MFLKFLPQCNSGKIYSIALVISNISHNLYSIRYNDTNCTIYTHEMLHTNDWIRFVGNFKEGEINAEYVEILYNVDMNVLKKAMKELSADESII